MKLFPRIPLLIWLLLAGQVLACSVPVYRYALERWPADPYRLTIFQRGALSAGDSVVVDAVRKAGEDGLANLEVRIVDVEGPLPDDAKKLWAAQVTNALPWAVIQYPVISELEQPVGQGVMDAKYAQQILDSPVRRELCQRISAGDSIVWLVLEGGDKGQDDAIVEMLRVESAKLAESLKVPPVDPDDPRTDVNVILKISFSTLRLSRSNPGEKFLVSQLMNIQRLFADAKGPVVFPVFGRGRALCGMTGDELTPENIAQAAVFLTGACSCEVKAMNPGIDLLFTADWDGSLEGRAVKETEMPPLVSLSQLVAETQPVVEAPARGTEMPQPAASSLARNLIVVIGLVVAAVIAGGLYLRSKGKNNESR